MAFAKQLWLLELLMTASNRTFQEAILMQNAKEVQIKFV